MKKTILTTLTILAIAGVGFSSYLHGYQVGQTAPKPVDAVQVRALSIAGSDGRLYVVTADWLFLDEQEANEFAEGFDVKGREE